MIELIKEFLLFGTSAIIENGILLYFCKILWDIKKIKFWHLSMFCVSIILCQSLSSVPFARQIVASLFIVFYLFVISNKGIKKSIIMFFISNMYLLIFEVATCLVYDFLNIDFANMSLTERLIYLVPTRIIQIIVLIIFWRIKSMGLWWFGNQEEIEEEVVIEETEEVEEEE